MIGRMAKNKNPFLNTKIKFDIEETNVLAGDAFNTSDTALP